MISSTIADKCSDKNNSSVQDSSYSGGSYSNKRDKDKRGSNGKRLAMFGGMLALLMVGMGLQVDARADTVRFRYTGGRWSHARHNGWHRYWGGPVVGFYYAPTPVYVVPGYADPYYYSEPNFWYSDPSFGLSLDFGGGYYGGSGYHGDYRHRWHGDGDYRHYEGGHGSNGYQSGGYHGGSYQGGGYHSGSYQSGGYHGGSYQGGGYHGGGNQSGRYHGGGNQGGAFRVEGGRGDGRRR